MEDCHGLGLRLIAQMRRMDITEQDKQMLTNVHNVFYKARLIDSPDLANLGLMFTSFMQRLSDSKKPELKKVD